MKDGETVVRFVQIKEHVGGDASGRVFLRPTAVSKQDLSGRGDHSFSLVREAHIEENDFNKRAIAKTISDEWKSDPVIARVPTAHLRAILDDKGRREICVNSDPTTAKDDRLGACPAHAAALRSDPPKDKQRPAWLVLQAKVESVLKTSTAWMAALFHPIQRHSPRSLFCRHRAGGSKGRPAPSLKNAKPRSPLDDGHSSHRLVRE